jgi:hypothetical protein
VSLHKLFFSVLTFVFYVLDATLPFAFDWVVISNSAGTDRLSELPCC